MLFANVLPEEMTMLCLCHVFIVYRWLVIFFFAVRVGHFAGLLARRIGIALRKLYILCFDKYVIECSRCFFTLIKLQ